MSGVDSGQDVSPSRDGGKRGKGISSLTMLSKIKKTFSGSYVDSRLVNQFMESYEGSRDSRGRFEGKGKLVMRDGSYTGMFRGGFMHGRGTYEWRDGTLYKGQFEKHRLQGFGVYEWRNARYEGDIETGMRHGTGTLTVLLPASGPMNYREHFRDLEVTYEGDWRQGKREGEGVAYFDHDRQSNYSGQWRDDRQHGWGRMVYPSGNVYEGNWEHGVKQGLGMMHWYTKRELYVGDWKDNKPDGFGEYIWYREIGLLTPCQQHNLYKGQWKDGLRHGIGMFVYANGGCYYGQFKNNKKDGWGILTLKNGRQYQGTFRNDRLEGGYSDPVKTPATPRVNHGASSTAAVHASALPRTHVEPLLNLDIDDIVAFERVDDRKEIKLQIGEGLLAYLPLLRRVYLEYSDALPPPPPPLKLTALEDDIAVVSDLDEFDEESPRVNHMRSRPGSASRPLNRRASSDRLRPVSATSANTRRSSVNSSTVTSGRPQSASISGRPFSVRRDSVRSETSGVQSIAESNGNGRLSPTGPTSRKESMGEPFPNSTARSTSPAGTARMHLAGKMRPPPNRPAAGDQTVRSVGSRRSSAFGSAAGSKAGQARSVAAQSSTALLGGVGVVSAAVLKYSRLDVRTRNARKELDKARKEVLALPIPPSDVGGTLTLAGLWNFIRDYRLASPSLCVARLNLALYAPTPAPQVSRPVKVSMAALNRRRRRSCVRVTLRGCRPVSASEVRPRPPSPPRRFSRYHQQRLRPDSAVSYGTDAHARPWSAATTSALAHVPTLPVASLPSAGGAASPYEPAHEFYGMALTGLGPGGAIRKASGGGARLRPHSAHAAFRNPPGILEASNDETQDETSVKKPPQRPTSAYLASSHPSASDDAGLGVPGTAGVAEGTKLPLLRLRPTTASSVVSIPFSEQASSTVPSVTAVISGEEGAHYPGRRITFQQFVEAVVRIAQAKHATTIEDRPPECGESFPAAQRVMRFLSEHLSPMVDDEATEYIIQPPHIPIPPNQEEVRKYLGLPDLPPPEPEPSRESIETSRGGKGGATPKGTTPRMEKRQSKGGPAVVSPMTSVEPDKKDLTSQLRVEISKEHSALGGEHSEETAPVEEKSVVLVDPWVWEEWAAVLSSDRPNITAMYNHYAVSDGANGLLLPLRGFFKLLTGAGVCAPYLDHRRVGTAVASYLFPDEAGRADFDIMECVGHVDLLPHDFEVVLAYMAPLAADAEMLRRASLLEEARERKRVREIEGDDSPKQKKKAPPRKKEDPKKDKKAISPRGKKDAKGKGKKGSEAAAKKEEPSPPQQAHDDPEALTFSGSLEQLEHTISELPPVPTEYPALFYWFLDEMLYVGFCQRQGGVLPLPCDKRA
eukprot:Rmarinus@m.20832